MSFLNLPWQWDCAEVEGDPSVVVIKRWRRGPITIYRYEYVLNYNERNCNTQWWIYFWNDFGFGIMKS